MKQTLKQTSRVLLIVACAVCALCAGCVTGPKSKPTDGPPREDAYAQLQARIVQLAKDPTTNAYQLGKARAWLKSSRYEADRNDARWWPRAAFDEAARLTLALENHTAPRTTSTSTSLAQLQKQVRADVWARADRLRNTAPPCALEWIARAEVELVHAAYETETTTWRHGDPQIALAQAYLKQAASGQCD